jgi:hypothetical protein
MTDVRKIAEQAGFNIYENEIFFNHEYVMTENIFKVAMLVEQDVLSRMPNPAQVLREQQKMLDGVADKLLAQQENPERENEWLHSQFAMAALQGFIASGILNNNLKNNGHIGFEEKQSLVFKAYEFADLMLENKGA